MYFKSRAEAGKLLADQLVKKYTGADTTVVALNDGGVMVGAQIAARLHCPLTMLLTDAIELPRENVAVAGITQDGSFAFNDAYSASEIEDFMSEYREFIEEEKVDKMRDMHRQEGKRKSGLIKRSLIRDRNVVLVSDGLPGGFTLDLAIVFLKPIHIQRLIVATPLASVKAVDRMHVLADEICCLSVVEDYISTDHYYDVQDVPTHESVVQTIEHIIDNWRQ
jgi:putative phosphoribosyl transferase